MQKTLNITINGQPTTVVVNVNEIADLLTAANNPQQETPPAPEYLTPAPTITTQEGLPTPFTVMYAVNSDVPCIGVEAFTETDAPIGEFWSVDRSGNYNNQSPTGHGKVRLFECQSDGLRTGKVSEWVTF